MLMRTHVQFVLLGLCNLGMAASIWITHGGPYDWQVFCGVIGLCLLLLAVPSYRCWRRDQQKEQAWKLIENACKNNRKENSP